MMKFWRKLYVLANIVKNRRLNMDIKIEPRVCSLEHAKRIKELGVPQESAFYYYKSDLGYLLIKNQGDASPPANVLVSAFSIDEMRPLLPKAYNGEGKTVDEHAIALIDLYERTATFLNLISLLN